MKKQMLSLVTVVFAFMIGCRQDLEEELGLKYEPIPVPVDLEQFFTPAKNQKAYTLLRGGETRIDMHEYYLHSHRHGWDSAIANESMGLGHEYKTVENVQIDCMVIGLEPYCRGYNSAVDQIDACLLYTSPSPRD